MSKREGGRSETVESETTLGSRKHVCDLCGQGFDRVQNLADHDCDIRNDRGTVDPAHVRRAEVGPVEATIGDLPKHGLACTSKNDSKLHRPVYAEESMKRGPDGEIEPACTEARVKPQVAVDGHEYKAEYQLVDIRRRVPFAGYGLCKNPECFRHVELVDESESTD